jgi:hypothetical protein
MEDTQTTPDDQQIPEEAPIVESTAHPADEQSHVSFLDTEQEGLDDPYRMDGLSNEFAAPFQSDGIPVVNAAATQASAHGQAPTPGQLVARQFPTKRVFLVSLVVVVLASLFSMWVFAKPVSPSHGNASMVASRATASPPRMTPTQQTQGKATTPTPVSTTTRQGSPQASWIPPDQTLQQLGWTAAGRTVADALQAERTAATFTDREETLVFNEAGSRTGAVFVLTAGGKERFAHNDVRVSNNVLWNNITDPRVQLIQLVLNAQPTLVKFAAASQQQFAWVDVSFWRWQSRIDPNDQALTRRTSGIELDPATHQPRLHHMSVLLLRVNPGSQGTGAAMGGTGWLVSNYALDPAAGALPDIVSPA